MDFEKKDSEAIQRDIEQKRKAIEREIEEKRRSVEEEIAAKREETDRKIAEQRAELSRRHAEQIRIMNRQIDAREMAARIEAEFLAAKEQVKSGVVVEPQEPVVIPKDVTADADALMRSATFMSRVDLEKAKARGKAEAEAKKQVFPHAIKEEPKTEDRAVVDESNVLSDEELASENEGFIHGILKNVFGSGDDENNEYVASEIEKQEEEKAKRKAQEEEYKRQAEARHKAKEERAKLEQQRHEKARLEEEKRIKEARRVKEEKRQIRLAEEAERKAREEAERLAREEAERKAREEAERLAREEAERKAREEAERLAREEAERKAREEAERLAREEAERKAYEESERLAREEAERKAREEAERLVEKEETERDRLRKERWAAGEEQRAKIIKEREEEERQNRIIQDAERKARIEAEWKEQEARIAQNKVEAARKAREEQEDGIAVSKSESECIDSDKNGKVSKDFDRAKERAERERAAKAYKEQLEAQRLKEQNGYVDEISKDAVDKQVAKSTDGETQVKTKTHRRIAWGRLIALVVTALLVVLVSFFGAMYVYDFFHRQKDVAVVYPMQKIWSALEGDSGKKKTDDQILKDRINVLVMGTDYGDSEAEKDEPKRTDAMLLLSFDPVHNKIAVLSIPRDTKVILPGHRDLQKINAAYAFGGVMMAKQTVANLLGVPITHYALADWQAFTKIVDILGGVDLTVEHDMKYDDPYANLHIDLKSGYQHLNGNQAGQYVRYRSDSMGDIGRAQRQQKFVKAAADQMLTVGNVTRIPALLKTISDYVETDMDALTMLRAANSVKIFGKANIKTGTLYGEFSEENDISYWSTDEAGIKRILSELEIPSSKLN